MLSLLFLKARAVAQPLSLEMRVKTTPCVAAL